jgi:hypothetical protein
MISGEKIPFFSKQCNEFLNLADNLKIYKRSFKFLIEKNS